MSDPIFPSPAEAHPGYTANKAGTRIRCNDAECGLIMDLDDTANQEQVFAGHLATFAPVAESLPTPTASENDDIFGEVDDDPISDTAEINWSEVAETFAEDLTSPVVDIAAAAGTAPAAAVLGDEPVVDVPAEAVAEHVAADPAIVPEADSAPIAETILSETAAAQSDAPVEPLKKRVKKKAAEEDVPVLVGPTSKRKVKEVTEALATIKAGDRVSATFRTPRYGEFTIEATVLAGLTFRQLVVGAWTLGTAGKPTKYLQSITRLAAKGKHEMAILTDTEASEHLGMVA